MSTGRLAASADALGNVTTYSYSVAADTVTGPDGSTQVTSYSAGELTGVSGTAVRAQTYEYGPNWQRTLPQGETSCTDKLGRQYKTVYADGSEAVRYYNAKSQVVKSVTPAGRVTLYEYDALGRQVKQAYDMNANGLIDAADLVTITSYGYGTESGKTVVDIPCRAGCRAKTSRRFRPKSSRSTGWKAGARMGTA